MKARREREAVRRWHQTTDQREAAVIGNRSRQAVHRMLETPEQCQARLQGGRTREAARRTQETNAQQHQARLFERLHSKAAGIS